MKKLLTIILACLAIGANAQTGQKHDFIRTPNGYNTIVDWNLKAKSLNLPHYLLTARPVTQDSIGTIFLNTNSADPHIYIKNLVGSTYNWLAFGYELPTFTNDFKRTGFQVGFADTLHRTNLPWVINNTSNANPALVVNGSQVGAIQNWNFTGTTKARITSEGLLRGPGMTDISSSNNASIATNTSGTQITRNAPDTSIAGGTAVLGIQGNAATSRGLVLNVLNYYRSLFSVDAFGTVRHTAIANAGSGSAKGYWLNGGLKPTANNDKLVGVQVEPLYGISTVTSTGSLVGGTGYPPGPFICTFTGGTGYNLTAQVTSSAGVINAYTITNSGINYTVGDVVTFQILDSSGNPVGTGGHITITGITTYTGISKVSAWFKNAPIQLDPITTPAVLQTGMLWQDGTHLYGYINGASRQLDQQSNPVPNALTGAYGITGAPTFNGSAPITFKVDTARGKLVTTYGLLDTINAHGASAGYAINSTAFGLGTVAVDTPTVRGWIQTSTFNKTAKNAYTFNSIGTGNTDAIQLTNTTAATNVLGQNSPSLRFTSPYWTGSASASSDFIIHAESGFLTFKGALNGNAYSNMGIFSMSAGGASQMLLPGQLIMTNSFIAAARTDGIIIRNQATASVGNPNQIPPSYISGGSQYNTTSSAANYFNWDIHASGVSAAVPTNELDFMASQSTTTTPSYVKTAYLQNTGNLNLLFGNVVATPTASAINSTATATAAQVAGGMITSTSAAATTITLPTPAQIATQLGVIGAGTHFEFYVYNTGGANVVTITPSVGMTTLSVITGSNTMTIASGPSGIARFALDFSSTSSCTIARLQ